MRNKLGDRTKLVNLNESKRTRQIKLSTFETIVQRISSPGRISSFYSRVNAPYYNVKGIEYMHGECK
jgi:hypothetical protein